MYFVVNWCVFVLTVAAFNLIECHPTGAPESTCADLKPHHGVEPQTSKSPFVLKGRPKNHSIELIIESTDNIPFRGFAVQARLSNATSGAIGTFVVKGNKFHTISCFGSPDNTVTHSDRSDKNKLTVEWIPAVNHEHDMQIVFVGTVVKTAQQFWTNLISEKVILNTHAVGVNTVDDHHNHQKDSKVNSKKVKNSSSDKSTNYLLISSIVLLLFSKI